MPTNNRSLDRAITLLEILAQEGAMTLADLHRRAQLPKSTTRRLLTTLLERRLVRRSLSDDRYRCMVMFADIAADTLPVGLGLLADVASPYALEFTEEIGWPSDIHIREGTTMRISESTRHASPFRLYRGIINQRISHFASATGGACLAAGDDSEVAALHEATRSSRRWGLSRFNIGLPEYMDHIRAIREQGYATRLPNYLGEHLFDQLNAIAKPIFRNGQAFGGLSILWPLSYRSHQDFAREYLSVLSATTERINAEIARLDDVRR